MRIFSQILSSGWIYDLPEHLTSLQAATELSGLRSTPEGLKRQSGILPLDPAYSIDVKAFLYWPHSSTPCYVIAGNTNVHTYDGTTERDISQGTYATTEVWDVVQFHNRVILNNGVQAPQYWAGDDAATTLVDLPNWPVGLACKTLRAFKRYLVALGTNSPMTVRWSTPADPGNVPSSWAINDPTKDSGEVVLDLEGGELFDLVPLRDTAILYASNGMWRMEHIGGVYVFRFQRLNDLGVYAKRQAVEYQAGLHLVFGNRDLFIFDGAMVKSIAVGRVQRFIYSLGADELERVWLFVQEELKEVWVMIPTRGITLTWAWELGSFGVIRLPGVTWLGGGALWDQGLTWASAPGSWPDYSDTIWQPEYVGASVLLAAKGNRFYGFSPFALSDFPAEFEHTGIKGESNAVKTCYEVWPYFRGNKGTKVLVSVGARMNPDDEIQWSAPQQFTIGSSRKINTLISGRILALRVRSLDASPWVLEGYELEVKQTGVY